MANYQEEYHDGEYVIIDETGFYCNRELRDLSPEKPHPITTMYRSVVLKSSDDNPVAQCFAEIKSKHPNVKELHGITSKTDSLPSVSKSFGDTFSGFRDFYVGNPSKIVGHYRWVRACMIDGTLTPWYMAGMSCAGLDGQENIIAVEMLVDDCIKAALNDKNFDGMLSILDCDESQIKTKMQQFNAIIVKNQPKPMCRVRQ